MPVTYRSRRPLEAAMAWGTLGTDRHDAYHWRDAKPKSIRAVCLYYGNIIQ